MTTTTQATPLTSEDVRHVVRRFYSAFMASLILRGTEPWGLEYQRPKHKGTCGRYGDVFLFAEGGPRGVDVRLTGYQGDTPVWERAGLIPWPAAERLIRAAATPATTAALCDAVDAYRAHMLGNRPPAPVDLGGPLLLAETAAWHALIDARPAEQLDLFDDTRPTPRPGDLQ